MKNKGFNKKILLIIGIVLLIAVIITVLWLVMNGKDEKDKVAKEEVTKVNDSANIIKEATYEGLTINNIVVMTKDDNSTFTATVTNNTDEAKEVNDFYIVFKKGDSEVASVYAYIGEKLEPKESKDVTASIGMELTKDVADSVEYRAEK